MFVRRGNWVNKYCVTVCMSILIFPQIWLAGKFCDEFFAPYPFSCLSTLIKTRSSAENAMFIVYANCLQVTSDCSKQRCIGNRDILSSVFEY